jgi:hypothetical protein
MSRRKFTKEFKLAAVQRVQAGEPAGLVARSSRGEPAGVVPLEPRCGQVRGRAFPEVGQKRAQETRVAELERKIGQQVFLKSRVNRALLLPEGDLAVYCRQFRGWQPYTIHPKHSRLSWSFPL